MPQNLHHDQKTCHLFIATAVAAISRRVLTALLLTALKSSAAEVSELTARLKTCAEFAQKAAQLGSEIKSALRLISEFDQQVLDLGAHAHAMAAEAEFGPDAPAW